MDKYAFCPDMVVITRNKKRRWTKCLISCFIDKLCSTLSGIFINKAISNMRNTTGLLFTFFKPELNSDPVYLCCTRYRSHCMEFAISCRIDPLCCPCGQ